MLEEPYSAGRRQLALGKGRVVVGTPGRFCFPSA